MLGDVVFCPHRLIVCIMPAYLLLLWVILIKAIARLNVVIVPVTIVVPCHTLGKLLFDVKMEVI